MMLRRSWLLFSFLLSWSLGFGQLTESDTDSTFKTIQLPMFDLGFGWSFLFGDVGNAAPAPSPALQLSYGLSIRQAIMPYLSVSLDFSSGKFYGEKALGDSGSINYQTSVINQGLRFTYEAAHLFRKTDQRFSKYQPYLGAGISLISFRAKGDLKDENQNTYHYWSDGTIRSLPELANNVDLAEVISRDMVYESDLRDANLDGFGRYDQMALTVPIEVGFRYQFTKRIGAHIKGVYQLNFTDLLDNITSESLGDRQGNTANDNHLSAMVGVSVYLGEYRKPKRKKKVREPKPALIAENNTDANSELEASDQDSADSTFIADSKDDQAGNGEEGSLSDKAEGDSSSDSQSDNGTSTSSDVTDRTNLDLGTNDSSVNTVKDDSGTNETGLASVLESNSTAVNSGEGDKSAKDHSDEKSPTLKNIEGDSNIEISESVSSESGNTENQIEPNREGIKSGENDNEALNASSNESVIDDKNDEIANSVEASETNEIASSEKPKIENSNGTEASLTTSTSSKGNSSESTESQTYKPGEFKSESEEMSTFDLIDKTMNIESTEPKIAGSYHWADVNKDKYISADEVLHFIDLLFDGESKYTVPMIHELIEYYFDQD